MKSQQERASLVANATVPNLCLPTKCALFNGAKQVEEALTNIPTRSFVLGQNVQAKQVALKHYGGLAIYMVNVRGQFSSMPNLSKKKDLDTFYIT